MIIARGIVHCTEQSLNYVCGIILDNVTYKKCRKTIQKDTDIA